MRYTVIDFIRCVAIILVLIAHISQTLESSLGGAFGIEGFYRVSLGGLGVTMFLILSGIVLELQYGNARVSYSLFIIKRCLRIYPIYFMSLVVGISIYFIRTYQNEASLFSVFSTLGFRDLVLSLTGAYAFAGEWGGPFVATSWFIGLIMSLYFIFPFLSNLVKKYPHITIFMLLCISTFSRLIFGKYGVLPMRPADWFPLCRVFEFSLGIYLAISCRTNMWLRVDSLRRSDALICFISKMSFPLFLIHYPLCIIIPYLTRHGLGNLLAISAFIIISFILSWIAFVLDNKIPRSMIIQKLNNFFQYIQLEYGLINRSGGT